MRCAWTAYLNLLPHWMRQEVDRLGRNDLQELRLRIGYNPQLSLNCKTEQIERKVKKEDIAFVINAASMYSPWTAESAKQGYLTAAGGHRIGICGVCAVSGGKVASISQPNSLCIRVARDFPDIAHNAADVSESILIIGPPGSGKTTLLRDLIRAKSGRGDGCIAVVDEREELFPLYMGNSCFPTGYSTDILSGCSKAEGIDAVLRSMNPAWIAVDEITALEDCKALLHAGWCGVRLLATAHAGSMQDLRTRPVYQSLLEYRLFKTVLILRKDKSWTMERMQ